MYLLRSIFKILKDILIEKTFNYIMSRLFDFPTCELEYDKVSIATSLYPAEPLIEYGYTSFIGKNRAKMEVVDKLPTSQKEVHYVVNSLETHIPTKEDISIDFLMSKKYLDGKNVKLTGRFFHLWELVKDNDFLKEKTPICVISISSSPQESLSAVSLLRGNNKDLYCGINLAEEQEIKCTSGKVVVINMSDYKEIKTVKKSYADKAMDHFSKKKLANLIFADGSGKSENTSYEILLAEIVISLNTLDKNGTLILRVLDMFTSVTVKLMLILGTVFKTVKVQKPLSSRDSDSERYLIFTGYKSAKNTTKFFSDLFDKIQKEDKKFIVDIQPEISIPDEIKSSIFEVNDNLMKIEYQCINRMYEFILEKNYYGIKYNNYLETQLTNSQNWVKRYL